MRLDFGWLLRLLFNGWIKKAIEEALGQGLQPPVEIRFQTGTVRSRVITDGWK